MIIDAHTHIGRDPDGQRQSMARLKADMKMYGIDYSVVFPFNEAPDIEGASVRLLRRCDESLIPFLRFDPKAMKPEKLDSMLCDNAFRGVKLHTRAQDFRPTDSRYYPLYEVIERHSLPILFHTRKEKNRNSDPDSVAMLAYRFRKLNIIMGHFAAASTVAFDHVKRRSNLFVETSIFSTNYTIRHMAGIVGVRKLIFGSDAPYSDQEVELLKVRKSGLHEADMRRILWSNMASLLGL